MGYYPLGTGLSRESESRLGYRFTATVCANEEAKLHLKEKFKTLITEYSSYLQGKPSEEVFQINIDLLSLVQSD